MDKALASVHKSTGGMATAFDRVDASAGRFTRSQKGFLESNNRVTNQVQGFTRSLLSASSASDVLAAGLDRLENSTNMSLGKGIFLAGTAVAVQQIHQLHEEYKKLNAEVKKLISQSPDAIFRTSAGISAHVDKVTESIARLSKETKGGMWQRIKDAFGENLFTENGELLPDAGKADRRRAGDIESLQRKESELKFGLVDKRRQRSDLKADALGGAPDYEIKAKEIQMAHDEANHAVHMMTQAAIELDLAFKELAKTVNDKRMERSGMSLAELAATPEFVQPGMTYEQLTAGQQARKAMALDEQGEAARKNFQPDLAHNLFNEAGSIKDNLTNLKPSEKMSADFKGALRVTEEQLRAIAEKVTFKNL